MSIEDVIIEASKDSKSLSMAEIGWHLTAEEHRQAYATGVVYGTLGSDLEMHDLWIERANLNTIEDADGNVVGYADACPS